MFAEDLSTSALSGPASLASKKVVVDGGYSRLPKPTRLPRHWHPGLPSPNQQLKAKPAAQAGERAGILRSYLFTIVRSTTLTISPRFVSIPLDLATNAQSRLLFQAGYADDSSFSTGLLASPNGGFISTTSKRVRTRSISAMPCAASPAKSRRRTLAPPVAVSAKRAQRLDDAGLGLVEEAIVVDAGEVQLALFTLRAPCPAESRSSAAASRTARAPGAAPRRCRPRREGACRARRRDGFRRPSS